MGGEGHITGEESLTHRRYEALEEFARGHLDATHVIHRWSAHDLQPADGLPYVGRLSRRSSTMWTATGFRRWGFTNASWAAVDIAARIAGRDAPWADTFDAARPAPLKSARGIAKEATKDARHLIGDRLRGPQRESTDDIGPGEGALVKVGGRLAAASRDPEGHLHAVSPWCSHLGCRLAWNTAERSWDCPCHGSRFAPDGRVLQGPAVRPLESL